MPQKKFENKNKKIKILYRVSKLALGKGTFVPSARPDTRQRQHVCRVLTASTRQRMMEGPPASPEIFCRGLFFVECLTLGKEDVCRVSLFAECVALGKDGLCRVPDLPSAALSKLPLYRVPLFRHSAKLRALGK